MKDHYDYFVYTLSNHITMSLLGLVILDLGENLKMSFMMSSLNEFGGGMVAKHEECVAQRDGIHKIFHFNKRLPFHLVHRSFDLHTIPAQN